MYWNGTTYDIPISGHETSIESLCRKLEDTLVTKNAICENCGKPHKYDYGSIREEFKERPYFFGIVKPHANIGSAILLSGSRPIIDDYLLENYTKGNVIIEAIYVPEDLYEKWLQDEISMLEAINGADVSTIGYTGVNAYGMTHDENVAQQYPTGYLFATIVPNLKLSRLNYGVDFYYILIRVNRRGEITYLNDIKDTSTLFSKSEHERNKFIVFVHYDMDLFNRDNLKKSVAMQKDPPLNQEMQIAVAIGILFALAIGTAAWISISHRRRRTPPL